MSFGNWRIGNAIASPRLEHACRNSRLEATLLLLLLGLKVSKTIFNFCSRRGKAADLLLLFREWRCLYHGEYSSSSVIRDFLKSQAFCETCDLVATDLAPRLWAGEAIFFWVCRRLGSLQSRMVSSTI